MAGNATLHQLLETPQPADLGPGPRAGVSTRSQLDRELDSLFDQNNLPADRQALVRALVLLWHDHLDAAHVIVQDLDSPDGALVHGIMHRREPDYGNAKYWFRRVGEHRAFAELAKRVAPLLTSQPDLPAQLIPKGRWDPFAFVDQCQQAATFSAANKRVHLLRQIQRLETETLLDDFGA